MLDRKYKNQGWFKNINMNVMSSITVSS